MSTTFFPGQEIIEIRTEQLEELRDAAARAPLRRARLCLHGTHSDPVQEMVIAFCRDTYNRPHRHHGKSESFHVIEGRLAIVFFDDSGLPTRRLLLGPPGTGETFVYRLACSRWHTVIPLTTFAIIHETTTGPFDPADTEFASWAPDGTDRAEANAFLARLGYAAAAAPDGG
jgi:cupin fold WbuC family metalloprotein